MFQKITENKTVLTEPADVRNLTGLPYAACDQTYTSSTASNTDVKVYSSILLDAEVKSAVIFCIKIKSQETLFLFAEESWYAISSGSIVCHWKGKHFVYYQQSSFL